MKFAPETIDIEETRIEQFYEYQHLITMVVLKREVKLKLVITFQNDQNKQINERE